MSNNNSGKVELDGNIIAIPTTYSNCERCGRRLPDYAVCLCLGKDYTVRETRWTQEYCSKGCATSSRYTKEGA